MSDAGTCQDSLQVEALTEEEMERNRDYANGDLAEKGAPSNEPRPGAYLILRYHATLREQRVEYDKLENAMNEVSIWSKEVEAKRDAYKRVIVGLARDKDLGRLLEQVRLYGVIEDDMADYWDAVVVELAAELTP